MKAFEMATLPDSFTVVVKMMRLFSDFQQRVTKVQPG